jgi:D-3-phosphoglycerate dehydrogenase
VGLFGYGHTGRAMARKLSGFDVKIKVYDKYKTGYAEGSRVVQECEREEVVQESDILSIHLPLTEETEGLIDAHFLSMCKKGVLLVNTSRGKICHTADILSNLTSGHLGGVAMDVLEVEGAKDLSQESQQMYKQLFEEDRTIFSPHIAGWTQESLYKIGYAIAIKILNFANIKA